VSASEFAFLSLGMVLGVLSGAALVEILGSRPPAPREIRLTVTPNSIPRRRAATLAEDAFILPGPTPTSGAPADRRQTDRVVPGRLSYGTAVRSGTPLAGAAHLVSGLPLSRLAAIRPALRLGDPRGNASTARLEGSGHGAQGVAVPIHLEPDPQLSALRAVAARFAERAIVEQRLTAEAVLARSPARTAVADTPAPAGTAQDRGSAPPEQEAGPAATASGTPSGEVDGCSDVRRVAEERCAVAVLARQQAESSAEGLGAEQRAYDEHMTRAEQAAAAADARSIRAAKERAQVAFRDVRAAAGGRDGVEGAARTWLNEVNRINREARDAAATLLKEREAAHAIVTTVERLTVEADASRTAAESAEATCVASRDAVATCEEAAGANRTPPAAWPSPAPVGEGDHSDEPGDDESELAAAFGAAGQVEPAILRLMRGDRTTLARLVGELAREDPTERRRWQLALAGLVDSVVARAIEASYLSFPVDHPFWGMFTLEQNRDIASALSSLGYRFDGLGGWADDRVPSPRDMSLAVGYAGLDPMRTRHWPREHEMTELFRDVSVAADEFLAEVAGGLTLGELVSVLGRRADALADLWNDWARVRPLLLGTD